MKHLLSIADLSRDDLEDLLDLADSFAEVQRREIKKVPALRGKTVGHGLLRGLDKNEDELRSCRSKAVGRRRELQRR